MNAFELRRRRWAIHDQPHVVTMLTRARRPLFAEFDVARRVVDEMRGCHEQRDLDSLAWVLMPDHLRWLFMLRDRADLRAVMARFRSRTTIVAYTGRTRRAAIWAPAYHDHVVCAGEDLHGLGRHIVGHPVRTRLVARLGDYPHWDAVWV